MKRLQRFMAGHCPPIIDSGGFYYGDKMAKYHKPFKDYADITGLPLDLIERLTTYIDEYP